jgi:hypothetical protein
METQDRYFVQIKDTKPVEITQAEFMKAESHHGFHGKFPGRPATGGFGGGPLVQYTIRSGQSAEEFAGKKYTENELIDIADAMANTSLNSTSEVTMGLLLKTLPLHMKQKMAEIFPMEFARHAK